MMKNKKTFINMLSCLVATMLSVCTITSCISDNEDVLSHHAKYPFVGKKYIHQWTLQNTSMDFQIVIHFCTDSTFTLTPIKVATGESTRDHPAEGRYKVLSDGSLVFSGVNSYNTKIRGYKITLYEGQFRGDDYKLLNVHYCWTFISGNTQSLWRDFELE